MERVIPEMVFQSEINECGLACISMFADTQGINAPLSDLRNKYPISAHGTSLATLEEILSDLGISSYPVLFEHEELSALPLPAILHYGAGHYVVLAYRKGRSVCVMNPAIGQQFLTFEALKHAISGYALVLDEDAVTNTMTNSLSQKDTTKKNTSFLSCMSLQQTRKLKGIYKLMSMAFVVSLTLFIMPVMVSQAINNAYSSSGNIDFPYFLFLGAFVASTGLALIARIITERFIKQFVVLNSAAGFSRLLNNSMRFFDRRAPGDVFSRFAAWESAAAQKIELDNGLRTDWVISLIAFVIMAYMSIPLALISFASVTVMGAISVWAIYRDRYYTQQLQVTTAEQNEFILESIHGFTTIKSAGLAEERKKSFARFTLALFDCVKKKRIYEQIKNSLYQTVGNLEMVFFMLLAIPLLKEGRLSLGDFFAYSFVHQIFTSYITKIFFSVLQKNQLQVIDKRAEDLFSLPELRHEFSAEKGQALSMCKHLDYRNITFRYDDEKILKNISLHIVHRQSIAIVGASGAGKSTLIKVMAGLLPPNEGSFNVDGEDVFFSQANSLVFLQSQEDIIFRGNVLENITLFDPHYDDTDRNTINLLLEALNLDEVLNQLPGGVHALVSSNYTGLSLGQRQRLLLARAMYSRRPVMILDEPTANLDKENAQRIAALLIKHCREKNKTLVVVTHSQDILHMFDRVYQMTQGQLSPEQSLAEPKSA